MVESSHEHLNKYLNNFISIQQAAQKINYIGCWLNPSLRAFIKIYYYPKFNCHIVGSSKGYPILTIFNKMLLQHLLNHKFYGIH